MPTNINTLQRWLILPGYFSLPMLFVFENEEFLTSKAITFFFWWWFFTMAFDFKYNGTAFSNIILKVLLLLGRAIAGFSVLYFIGYTTLDLLVRLFN